MDIEIAKPEKMSQSGSALLRLIQNNDMPIIDLFVRESLQNSLDASKKQAKYVKVEYNVGNFKSDILSNELKGISEKLKKRYGTKVYKYISIRDIYTEGLTGPINYDDIKNGNYGNLLKLVYEISKPQESEGAGGSWGLGKTVFFRLGIGLVIYYSRIKKDTGIYEERLAATFVEDENAKDAIIPEYNGKLKRGIAWWGKLVGENKTEPVTDSEYIKDMLDIFGISAYSGDETGTTVIIPYIDEENLLNSNQCDYINHNLYWRNDISSYLELSIQKWYSPRIENKNYKYGKQLKVSVNGNTIKKENMYPLFRAVQDLYNCASRNNIKNISTEFLEKNKYSVAEINLKKVIKPTCVGRVAFAILDKKDLQMIPPDNYHSPYIMLNIDESESEGNRPIITFCRKPGMMVSYEIRGDWCDKINSTEPDKYLLAVFVLESDTKMVIGNKKKLSVEEYIRRNEKADHNDWLDSTIEGENPAIVSKIKKHVNNKIQSSIDVKETDNEKSVDKGLGSFIGKSVLPPEDFGCGATKQKKNNPFPKEHKAGKLKYKIKSNEIKYGNTYMQIPIKIESKQDCKGFDINCMISVEGKKMSLESWINETNIKPPFYIDEWEYTIKNRTGKISKDDIFYVKYNKAGNGDCMSVSVYTKEKTDFLCEGILKLRVINRAIKINVDIREGGEK